jgi:hypothetical protein
MGILIEVECILPRQKLWHNNVTMLSERISQLSNVGLRWQVMKLIQ